MKKLKLELKQTMDMYSSACREAISAKKKVTLIFLTTSGGGDLNQVLPMLDTGQCY